MTQPQQTQLEYADRYGSFVPPPFRPSDGRARWAIIFLWVWVGTSLLQVFVGAMQWLVFSDFFVPGSGTGGGINAQLIASVILGGALSLLHFGAYVTATVFLMIWLYRVLCNLRAMGREPMFNPGLSVGFWFIPFANLVVPPMILSDLLRKSGRGGGERAWVLWSILVSSVLIQIAGTVWQQVAMFQWMRSNSGNPGPAVFTHMFNTPAMILLWASYPIWTIGLVVLIGIIREVQRRQAETWQHTQAAPS